MQKVVKILYYNKMYTFEPYRECCIIMGGRNNKFCDQKGQDPKRVRQARNPPNEILPWVKRTISNVNDW